MSTAFTTALTLRRTSPRRLAPRERSATTPSKAQEQSFPKTIARSIPATCFFAGIAECFLERSGGVVAVELGDPADADFFRAGGLALVLIRAVAEAFFVHLADHAKGAAVFLGLALGQEIELTSLGGDEEHGAGVFARGHAGPAADAGGGIHGGIRHFLADGESVRILRRASADGDETTGLLDTVEGGTVHHEVLQHGESAGAEGLDPDGVARAELTHVELTGGGGLLRAVWDTIDLHGAGAADTLAAVMIERDGILSLRNKPLIDDVHHFQERGMVRDFRGFDVLEMARLRTVLTPDFEVEVEIGHGGGLGKTYL